MVVCVNFADLAARTLPHWQPGLASLLVVSTEADRETADVCTLLGIDLYTTDAFKRHGAAFNKGAAMEEALPHVPWRDWILLFDIDIIPPARWWEQLGDPQPGKLYGAHRWDVDTDALIMDREWPGYFQLFHSGDPRAQDRPLFDTAWRHAGGYDTVFQNRWGVGANDDHKVRLDLHLKHIGQTGNWWGRGEQEQLRRMYRLRRQTGSMAQERIE